MPTYASGLWGAPAGQAMAQEQQLQQLQGMASIAATGAQIQHLNAQTQKLQQENLAMQQMRQAQQARAKVRLQQVGQQSQPQVFDKDYSRQLWETAQDATDAGLFTLANNAARTASYVDHQVQSARNLEVTETLNRLKAANVIADRAATLARGVTDQRSFDAANAQFEQETGRPSPYKGMQYSPQLVQGIQEQALTTKQRLDYGIKNLDLQSKDEARKHTAKYQDTMARIRESEAAMRRESLNMREKNAGTHGLMPPERDIKAASALIESHFKGIQPSESRVLGTQLAELAGMIARQHQGLNGTVAMNQAFQIMKQDGKFAGTRAGTSGRSMDNPAPAPADRSFKKGLWYQTPKGVLYFNGTNFLTEQEFGLEQLGSVELPPEDDTSDETDTEE